MTVTLSPHGVHFGAQSTRRARDSSAMCRQRAGWPRPVRAWRWRPKWVRNRRSGQDSVAPRCENRMRGIAIAHCCPNDSREVREPLAYR
jgi:hypothetical protein